jgi:S-adenosylmethionine decarboxylase
VLEESHISIHSWPENGYAALDVFMSGDADPARTVPVLQEAFEAGEVVVKTHLRGSAPGENGERKSKAEKPAPARLRPVRKAKVAA